jgi:uncharacterized protein (TIGR00296 family)
MMADTITLAQAKELILLARESISAHLEGRKVKISDKIKKEFADYKGVFVTLYVDDELAGCIGFPEPVMPLWEAVVNAAKSAAFSDPRFEPLDKERFARLRIEISVLTKPELITVKDAKEYPSNIKVGKDGLIVKDGFNSGLLLPQVAVEWHWDSKQFISQTCVKAGLSADWWLKSKPKVYKFQAQVFAEQDGKIVDKTG